MLKPDSTLLIPSVANDPRQDGVKTPALYRFQSADKDLLYVNAHHTSGEDNPTVQAIAQAFQDFAPDAAVVELPQSDLPRPFAAIARPFPSEPFAVAAFAQKHNIPLYGGEPERSYVNHGLFAQDYSLQDIQAYWFLLSLPRLVQNNQITPSYPGNPAHIAYAHDNFRLTARSMGLPAAEAMRFDDYRDWFKQHYPAQKNMWDMPGSATFPVQEALAPIGQKMAYAHLCLREPHIIRIITQALNKNKTVLAVYGANHFLAHRPVFEKMLGPAILVTKR